MTKTLMLAAMVVSTFAFAAPPPAPAPAPAPAKAAPAAAAAAAAPVTAADCDMHKAEAEMMKSVIASKAKVEMVKLDYGTTTLITTDAKSAKGVETAMTGMEGHLKEAMENKAKVCDECKQKMDAMKTGKVMGGMGHGGNVWTMTMLSNDAETVKMMHAQVDAKTPPAAAKAAPKK